MPSKGPSRASALMAMLAFHEVVTRATERASPACHIEVRSRLLRWAVPRHSQKHCFQAHRHRGEPTAGDRLLEEDPSAASPAHTRCWSVAEDRGSGRSRTAGKSWHLVCVRSSLSSRCPITLTCGKCGHGCRTYDH